MCSWFVPTNQELEMSFLVTLWFMKTLPNPNVIDRIKKELTRGTTIKR